jgi:hypothetical protein
VKTRFFTILYIAPYRRRGRCLAGSLNFIAVGQNDDSQTLGSSILRILQNSHFFRSPPTWNSAFASGPHPAQQQDET